jgi:hypothetical protein
LVKELNTIVQFTTLNHNQNINKQVQVQYQLEMKKAQVETELNEYYDLLNGQNANKVNLEELNLKGKLNLLTELNNLILVNNQLIAKLKETNPLLSIEFVSNYSAIQTSIRNTFGLIRITPTSQPSANNASSLIMPHQINTNITNVTSSSNGSSNGDFSSELNVMCDIKSNKHKASANSSVSNSRTNLHENLFSPPLDLTTKKKLKTSDCFEGNNYAYVNESGSNEAIANSTLIANSNDLPASHYNMPPESRYSPTSSVHSHESNYNKQLTHSGSHMGLTSCNSNSNSAYGSSSNLMQNYPQVEYNMKNSVQLTRSKMIFHCKFGEFGVNNGQFTEPSGVTINTNNDIIVADTNSHRIQIFDREGNFKFKFGECGKRDGQLLYPNRVSIVKQTGDIVVTERSPTHQIQIYNSQGQFLRKFGAAILQHPRGVYVDYKGRIVVVECKVMRVIIFDLYGNVLNKFNCSKYLEFPNGVCCSRPGPNDAFGEEIYISDNR